MGRLLFSQSSLVLDCNLYKLHHAAISCVNKNQFTLSKSVPPVTSGSPIRYFEAWKKFRAKDFRCISEFPE